MAALVSSFVFAALLAGEGEFAIHLHRPPEPAARRQASAGTASAPAAVPYGDDVVPLDPEILAAPRPRRKLGTNTTIYVNFDGVTIGECSPSNSHENCHWLEKNTTFEPWSGSLAQRVAILDAMRSIAAGFGIRVTGQRPLDSEPYLMVVYGGDSIEEEALGRAPGGDCWDDLPNQIAYVYLDGERVSWINGGASTAMHESAHSWGFDHIGLEGSLMAPAGGNTVTKFFDGCAQVVDDTELNPGGESCPQINLEECGLSAFQHDVALLRLLFGEPYVDDRAPKLELVRPFDGVYYQGPADFEVVLEVTDDLHPQVYEIAIGVPGLIDEPSFSPVIDPSFEVESFPLGSWTFEVRLRDAAGNESSLSFDVEVGEEPVELDDGCACATGPAQAPDQPRLGWLWALVILSLAPRRKLR